MGCLPAYRCWTGDMAEQEQHLQPVNLLLAVCQVTLLALMLVIDVLQSRS